MIQSFEINGFRFFDHLKINHLSRVNLIVGKNNAGKSAFLEALLLYCSKFSKATVAELLKNRMEDSDFELTMENTVLSDSIRHFFKNHTIPKIGGKLSLSSDGDELQLESAAFIIHENYDTNGRFVRDRKYIDKTEENDETVHRCLLVKRAGASKVIELSGTTPHSMSKPTLVYSEQFVSSSGISDEQAAQMWDMLTLSGMENYVLSGLKLIEISMENLAFIKSGEQRNSRVPVIKLNGFDVPVPLKSLGDGMTRILHIILSLVSCRKGAILAIDEFENGLHWSIQPKVWKMIFNLANKLDVQVFASTHSRDCVAGFYEAWDENESDGAFLRLMRGEGQPPVQEYDLELLRGSLQSTIEVR